MPKLASWTRIGMMWIATAVLWPPPARADSGAALECPHGSTVLPPLEQRTWISATVPSGDPWSDAEQAVNTFIDAYRKLKALDESELQALVTAICDAEEDDRKAVGAEASARVKATVIGAYDELMKLRDAALTNLKAVLADTSLQSRYSQANDYVSRVNDLWTSIDKMTYSVRGANHPVVSYMLDRGQQEHKNYQGSSSNCTVSEWTVPSGRADCIYADGTTGYVIEIKPRNARAIAKGRQQARGYADDLNNSAAERAKLAQKDSRFNQVTTYVPKIMAYTLCPEIDEDGNFKEVSTYWTGET
jgi:hypothetical protein